MKLLYYALVAAMFLFLNGCSSTDSVEGEAIELITNFKKAQYELAYNEISNGNYDKLTSNDEKAKSYQKALTTINDKVKPFLTEQEYETFLKNRVSGLTLDAVLNKKYDIKVSKMELDQITVQDKDKSIIAHYTMDLKLTSTDKRPEKTITKKGQITLIKENSSLKVDRDWDGYLTEKDIE